MTTLLDRVAQARAGDDRADYAMLLELIALGDDAPAGAETDIARVAAGRGMTDTELAALAGHAVELRNILPVLAAGPEKRIVHKAVVQEYAEARKLYTQKVEELDKQLKALYQRKAQCAAESEELVRAQIRLNWMTRECPILVEVMLKQTGVELPTAAPPPPPPQDNAKALPPEEQSKPAPAHYDPRHGRQHRPDSPSANAPGPNAERVIVDPDGVAVVLEPAAGPHASRPSSNIGAAFQDLREQARAQRKQMMERRSRQQ